MQLSVIEELKKPKPASDKPARQTVTLAQFRALEAENKLLRQRVAHLESELKSQRDLNEQLKLNIKSSKKPKKEFAMT